MKMLPSATAEILITQKCNMNCTYCFENCKSGKSITLDDFLANLPDGKLPFGRFYIFGGEPTLNMSFVINLLEWVDNHGEWPEEYRRYISSSITNNLITNGVKLEELLQVFKKYGISLQISLDGPEDINDACRVDYNGNGHFKDIMANIALCQKEGIPYTIHGAIAKQNYHNFARIVEWFLKMTLDNPIAKKDIRVLENVFRRNFAQIVIEDEIDDNDIDIFLCQLFESVQMILTTPLLDDYSEYTRRKIAVGLLNRRGGICAAGRHMLAYDERFQPQPCHRIATSYARLKYDTDQDRSRSMEKMKLFQNVSRLKVMYGPFFTNYGFRDGAYFVNWCPATNYEVTGDPFCMPPFHNVLLAELQRYVPRLADYFGLDLAM